MDRFDISAPRRRLSAPPRLLLPLLLLGVFAAAPAVAETLALVGGRLIDGYGGRPLGDSVVLVEGERIVAVDLVVHRGRVAVPPSR